MTSKYHRVVSDMGYLAMRTCGLGLRPSSSEPNTLFDPEPYDLNPKPCTLNPEFHKSCGSRSVAYGRLSKLWSLFEGGPYLGVVVHPEKDITRDPTSAI